MPSNPQTTPLMAPHSDKCEHAWEEIESQFTRESFTNVRCKKCGEVGERNEQTGGVFWPAT